MSLPSFDPYESWLGISPPDQPADHYRLLGLPRYEAEPSRIARGADERMALVRSFQTGPRGAYTQKLLNELAAARVCLLDPNTKAEYDRELADRLAALEVVRRAISSGPSLPAEAEEALAVPQVGERAPVVNAEPAQRSTAWQPVLLVSSAVLSVILAVGGWALGRRRSHEPNAAETRAAKNTVKTIEKAPAVMDVISADTHGAIWLDATKAALVGELQRTKVDGVDVLTRWNSHAEKATWGFHAKKPGYFKADLTYATSDNSTELVLELRIDNRLRVCSLPASGGLDRLVTEGFTIVAPSSGVHQLTVQPRGEPPGERLILRGVRLIPVEANRSERTP